MRELLEELAADEPLVLVLDDLHWADSASVELVGSAAAPPACAAGADRDGRAAAAGARAADRGARAGAARRRSSASRAGALTQPEARRVPRRRLAEADLAALHQESGGNPFYLEQLAGRGSRGRGGAPAHRPLADIGVPPDVAAALTEELALLPRRPRGVLRGRSRGRRSVRARARGGRGRVPRSRALEALDELLRVDLVRSTDVPRRFRFRHPLVRRAVYESTPGAWRLGAHERSADALAARGRERRRRAPTTSSARRALATPARSRSCAEAGEAASGGRPRAQRAGSQARCACSTTMRPPQSASSCCSPGQRAGRHRRSFRESHAALLAGLAARGREMRSSCA